MNRTCGSCTLCCVALPVRSLAKPANTKCQHQSHARGCKVYCSLETVSPECRLWSCLWLRSPETAALSRPDRSGYVLDPSPEFVTARENDGTERTIPVVQVWVDPKRPDAHKDPALRAYLRRLAARDGTAAL